MRLVLAITAVLAAAGTASAAPKKGNLVRDNSKSINGEYVEVLPGTYSTTCYEPDPDCVSDGDYYDYCEYIDFPCDRPCGSTRYSFDGYTLEDGSKEIYVGADYYSDCILEDGFVSYSCSATVSVPPATWTQKLKSATIKFSATLTDCSSYAYTYGGDYESVDAPEPNPLEGTKVSLDASLACKTVDKTKYTCRDSYTYGGERFKQSYGATESTCSLVSVPGLKINGKSKVLDSARFGTYKYFDKFLSFKPKRKGPK